LNKSPAISFSKFMGIILLMLTVFSKKAVAQDYPAASTVPATDQQMAPARITGRSLRFIDTKYAALDKSIDQQTEKVLKSMRQKEEQLQKKVQQKDSLKAKALFADMASRYSQLENKLRQPVIGASIDRKSYVPGLDSIQTAIHFLEQKGISIKGISPDKLQQLQAVSDRLQQLQGKWQAAGAVQQYISDREALLKGQLAQYGLDKQLLGINQEAWYYQQRLAGYKDMINNKEKLEQTVLDAARKFPAFTNFFQHNSWIAQLFPVPANYGTVQALAGLQTNTQIQGMIRQSTGAASPDAMAALQQQMQQARSTLDQLKSRASQLGSNSGSGDMTMPDFNPDNQKTKSFFSRLEYGFNIQSVPGNSLLPAISDIAVTLGYRLSDKATTGIGVGYKLGWGKGFNDISLSNQGASLRSYVDIKAKRSLWITGGMEYNYLTAFSKLADLKKIDLWQKSALIGLTKKYSISKKSGSIQLLYDLLYMKEVPLASPFKFRVGYSF